jgi:Uma2 family endonuclease
MAALSDVNGSVGGERWELIAGELINKAEETPPHSYVLNMILPWLSGLFGTGLRCQSAIEVREEDQALNAPQPDFAIVVEMKQEYAERLPRGDELALVIEVANTSSRIDLSPKARLYARSSVPEYWVIDIAKRRVVIHRQAGKESYALVESLAEDQVLSLAASSIMISSFLPRASAS